VKDVRAEAFPHLVCPSVLISMARRRDERTPGGRLLNVVLPMVRR
jgi:hypothetical protein